MKAQKGMTKPKNRIEHEKKPALHSSEIRSSLNHAVPKDLREESRSSAWIANGGQGRQARVSLPAHPHLNIAPTAPTPGTTVHDLSTTVNLFIYYPL